MADVDSCVRECELALSGDLEKHSGNIVLIPDSRRVGVFRGKPREYIKTVLENCKKSIQVKIANTFYENTPYNEIILNKGSNDNKIGADLYHSLPDGQTVEIEVKFGLETNKQIGMLQFERIFGTDVFTKALDLSTRKIWVADFVDNDFDESLQYSRLVLSLNSAIHNFNKLSAGKNYTLTKGEQDYMESLIMNNSGNGHRTRDYYLKFIIEGDDMRDIKELPTGLGYWNIDEVKNLSECVKRVNIFVINKTTNIQIKYTLNWKNNYKISGRGKVSAKLGFGSPSWNVWVSVDVSEIEPR